MSDTESNEEEFKETIGTYEGERNEARERHGKGKMLFKNNELYTGNYKNGKREGYGVYKFKNGAKYSGNYVNNLREGEGNFLYPDGSKYQGSFKEGKRCGFGKYIYTNGDYYEGEWEDDMKNGKGTYTFIATGSKKSGTWKNGVLVDEGQIIHADQRIIGKFVNNDYMDVPAKIQFRSTLYQIEVNNPNLLGQNPLEAPTEEE